MRLHTMFSNTTSHERGTGPVGPFRKLCDIFWNDNMVEKSLHITKL